MTNFCLVMIVKDEAPIITRAFESMKNIFDSYLICDTGSTDNTTDIINEWMNNNNKIGEIIFKEWKNFGYNKSYLLEKAYNHQEPLISRANYFVWLDADEVWITNPNDVLSYPSFDDRNSLDEFMRSNSDKNVCSIMTHYGGITYKRPNLCVNNQLYMWKQPVHEYFEGTEYTNMIHYDKICLLARKEGNSSRNPDRYRKDADMFLEFLEENPNEPRATFYLAQTYESFDRNKAIEWYKKRVELVGFYQERYIACLRLGRLLTDKEEKQKAFWKGTEIIPHRLECWYELLMSENTIGNHKKAAFYGLLTPKKREPEQDDMFAEMDIYNTTFDLNFAVSCYYAGLFNEGLEANLRALRTTKDGRKNLIQTNLKYFENKVKISLNEPPRQEIIIIDNFYENPDMIREKVLQMDFHVKGNYPGTRTDSWILPGTKEKFESIIGRKITYWPDGYNGSFQYTTEDMKSWIHRDLTEWSAIVYLSPNAPADGGTILFRHKQTGLEYTKNKEDEDLLNKDTYNPDAWEIVDRVGNKYNRCVLFRGKRTHISDRYFGKTKEDGRLFQTFFFNDK